MAETGKPAADKPPARTKKGGGRAAAAKSAIGAAKGTGEAAPVVAPAAYVKARHDQRKQARAQASEERAQAREQRASESHSARMADRQARLNPPKVGRPRKFIAWTWGGSRRVLTAEFLVCVVVLIVGYLLQRVDAKATQTKAGSAPGTTGRDDVIHVMVKGSALAAVFFLLALLQAGGKGSAAAKTSTALGTLVTATYVLTSSDVHAIATWINAFFKPPTGAGTTSGSGNG